MGRRALVAASTIVRKGGAASLWTIVINAVVSGARVSPRYKLLSVEVGACRCVAPARPLKRGAIGSEFTGADIFKVLVQSGHKIPLSRALRMNAARQTRALSVS